MKQKVKQKVNNYVTKYQFPLIKAEIYEFVYKQMHFDRNHPITDLATVNHL